MLWGVSDIQGRKQNTGSAIEGKAASRVFLGITLGGCSECGRQGEWKGIHKDRKQEETDKAEWCVWLKWRSYAGKKDGVWEGSWQEASWFEPLEGLPWFGLA